MAKRPAPDYRDESVPALPETERGHPLVVFGDHRFCAGETTVVQRMKGPHMHSQIELNFVLEGEMTLLVRRPRADRLGRPPGAVLGHDPAPGDRHRGTRPASWFSMCR